MHIFLILLLLASASIGAMDNSSNNTNEDSGQWWLVEALFSNSFYSIFSSEDDTSDSNNNNNNTPSTTTKNQVSEDGLDDENDTATAAACFIPHIRPGRVLKSLQTVKRIQKRLAEIPVANSSNPGDKNSAQNNMISNVQTPIPLPSTLLDLSGLTTDQQEALRALQDTFQQQKRKQDYQRQEKK